jgi:drug/metabolite transporter (DMT)-like permease
MGGIWVLTREVSAHARAGVGARTEASAAPAFEPRLGIAFGLGAALALGVGHALRKVGMVFIPSPMLGSAIGALVALLAIVSTYARKATLADVLRSNFRPLNVAFLISGIFVSLGQLTLFVALYLSPASLAVVIGSTEPLWVLLFSRLLLGVEEHLSWLGVLAIVVICVGVAVILVA